MPERKISTLKAPAKNDSEMIAHSNVAEHRLAMPSRWSTRGSSGPSAEVEEVHLHQRRRVAEELDVALHERLEQAQAAALQPRADDADQHAAAGCRTTASFTRRPHAANEARALEAVVEDGRG